MTVVHHEVVLEFDPMIGLTRSPLISRGALVAIDPTGPPYREEAQRGLAGGVDAAPSAARLRAAG